MLLDKITNKVGDTPLIKWNNIYLKMENSNPTGSIKDRPCLNMLKELISNKMIKKGDTIICPTSGNMGISLAYFSNFYSIKVIIVLPDNSTKERIDLLKSLNAEIILTSGFEGMKGSIKKAKELSLLHNYYYFDQFKSEDNYLAHYTTIEEIIKQLPNVDTIVCGIGTGGTYIGLCRYIKEHKLKINVVGYEPINVSLISNLIYNASNIIDSTKDSIPGVGSTVISDIILNNISYIDKIVTIDPEIVRSYWKELINQNLDIGLSGAASIYIANNLNNESPNNKIVAIIPDGLNRYLSDLNV